MSNHTQCQNKPRSMFLRSATGLFVYHYMSDVIDTHVNSVPSGGCVYQPIIDLRVDTGNAMSPDYGHAVVIRLSVIGHSGGAVVCLYGYHLSIDLATDSATSGSGSSAGTLRSMSGVGTSCVSSSSSFLSSSFMGTPPSPIPIVVYIMSIILSAPFTKASRWIAQSAKFTISSGRLWDTSQAS